VHRRGHGDCDAGGGVIAVRIARAALDAIGLHAHDALPAECCGVLIGKGENVLEAVRVANIAADRHRFELDPQGHIDARRAARHRGLDVVGFYHSHPHSEPEPSPTDQANASYTDHLYLIVRPLPEGAKVRLFLYDGSQFVERPFVQS
jgi:proteasome lid subunit RPN8/RPN11